MFTNAFVAIVALLPTLIVAQGQYPVTVNGQVLTVTLPPFNAPSGAAAVPSAVVSVVSSLLSSASELVESVVSEVSESASSAVSAASTGTTIPVTAADQVTSVVLPYFTEPATTVTDGSAISSLVSSASEAASAAESSAAAGASSAAASASSLVSAISTSIVSGLVPAATVGSNATGTAPPPESFTGAASSFAFNTGIASAMACLAALLML
ncbi:MAG: hypothetical protein M1833_006749 [Piccolia ochrophora]|nr:MAG: hypothetical protein M1833_006749 [Piccolia ochrophora]